MQSLKDILAKKKGEVGTSFNRADLEKTRVQKFRQEEDRIEVEKQKKLQKRLEQMGDYYQPRKIRKTEESSGLDPSLTPNQTGQKLLGAGTQQPEQQAPTPADLEAQRQLHKQMIINKELNKKIKDEEEYEQLDGKLRPLLIEPKLMDELSYRTKKLKMLESAKSKDTPLPDKCDQILLWSKKVLKVWLEALELKYNTQDSRKTRQSKDAFNLYKLACQHLEPLFIVLRARDGDIEMIDSILHIMNCCLLRDYREANDRYIQMSIGNAPWPMGVVMLGITVRKNTPRLAHVLNDPISRKWTQSIKRLLTLSQELYPNEDNTKMVLYSVASILG